VRRRLAAVLLSVALGAAPPALATTAATPRTTLHAMEEQVMCVVCKTPLAVANGPQADDERAFISHLIAQGKTEQQIKDALVVEFGERVLALPNDHGFNLAVYLVPVLVLLGGLVLLVVMLPRWRRRRRTAPPAAALGAELSEQDARRLDEDLARYDG
jgi:cytochrome c-type biogenesis protein CcmH